MPKHDNAYHALFSHPELVQDLIQHFIPETWTDHLDFTDMERINTKFHTEGLDHREGDIIYRIGYKEGRRSVYVCLLLEFQSTPDKWMPLRVMVYVGLLYQQLIKEGRLTKQNKLPPVFPLVLYNGDKSWRYPHDLHSLIDLPRGSPLRHWQPQMRNFFLDESRYPKGKTGSLNGALFSIENSSSFRDIVKILAQLHKDLLRRNPGLLRTIRAWSSYYIFQRKGLKLTAEEVHLLGDTLEEVSDMLQTRIDQWEKELLEQGMKEGIQQGIQKGIQQGRAENKEESRAEVLTILLTQKFGTLPPWAEQKLTQANFEQLDTWVKNILTASTLEEVFG